MKDEKKQPLLVPNSKLNKYFSLGHMISSGAFGQVYAGSMVRDGYRVAIKAESMSADFPLLRYEAECLSAINRSIRDLYQNQPYGEPFPRYFGYGEVGNVRYLIMDLCGKNMRELKKGTPFDRFSMYTSLWLMKKMIESLRFLHQLGWIHRDVKPANFCIGVDMAAQQQLFLVDFGMARRILDEKGTVIPRRQSCSFRGTVRYASLTTHRLQDMSRFDDLWSAYYICVENMVGFLPWRYISDKAEVAKIKESCDLLHDHKFGEENGPPPALTLLYRHLSHAGYYYEPKYDIMLQQIDFDIRQRNHTAYDRLDWQTLQKEAERKMPLAGLEQGYDMGNQGDNREELNEVSCLMRPGAPLMRV